MAIGNYRVQVLSTNIPSYTETKPVGDFEKTVAKFLDQKLVGLKVDYLFSHGVLLAVIQWYDERPSK